MSGGASLVGVHVFAQVRNLGVSPPGTAIVEYRITKSNLNLDLF